MATRTRALARVPYRISTPRPIVIRAAAPAPAKRRHRGRARTGGGDRGLLSKSRVGILTGAAIVGFLQRQKLPLPELPILGQTGTIGIAAYLLSDGGKNKLLDEVATAALAIAAYQLGSTGSVVGEDVAGYVAGV
jgi:hypothetical protein